MRELDAEEQQYAAVERRGADDEGEFEEYSARVCRWVVERLCDFAQPSRLGAGVRFGAGLVGAALFALMLIGQYRMPALMPDELDADSEQQRRTAKLLRKAAESLSGAMADNASGGKSESKSAVADDRRAAMLLLPPSEAMRDAAVALLCAIAQCLRPHDNEHDVPLDVQQRAAMSFASCTHALTLGGLVESTDAFGKAMRRAAVAHESGDADGADEAGAVGGAKSDDASRLSVPGDVRWPELCLELQHWLEAAPIDARGKNARALVCAVQPLHKDMGDAAPITIKSAGDKSAGAKSGGKAQHGGDATDAHENGGDDASLDDETLRALKNNADAHKRAPSVALVIDTLKKLRKQLKKIQVIVDGVARTGVANGCLFAFAAFVACPCM